jgi:hypothetical protein
MVIIASTSSRFVSKDDGRRWQIKIHAGLSEVEAVVILALRLPLSMDAAKIVLRVATVTGDHHSLLLCGLCEERPVVCSNPTKESQFSGPGGIYQERRDCRRA